MLSVEVSDRQENLRGTFVYSTESETEKSHKSDKTHEAPSTWPNSTVGYLYDPAGTGPKSKMESTGSSWFRGSDP